MTYKYAITEINDKLHLIEVLRNIDEQCLIQEDIFDPQEVLVISTISESGFRDGVNLVGNGQYKVRKITNSKDSLSHVD